MWSGLYYKVATGSEPISYTFTVSPGVKATGAISAYSDVDIGAPINAHAGTDIAKDDPFSAPSVTTTVAETTLVAFFANVGPNPITRPTGMTERWDMGSDIAIASADETFAGPGTTGDRTASFVNSEKMGQLIALTPAANAAPTAVDDTATVLYETTTSIDVLANDTDPDGDTLIADGIGPASNGTTGAATTHVVYTPNPGFLGVDSFNYTMTDGNGHYDSGTVTVLVGDAYLLAGSGGANGGDDLLTMANTTESSATTNEGDIGTGTGTIPLKGMDAQPGTATVFAAAGAQLGTIDRQTGTWSTIGSFGTGRGQRGRCRLMT